MKFTKGMIFVVLLVGGLLAVQRANAGVYGDELTKCIIESTSTENQIKFVRWIFALMSLHPDVKDMSLITDKQHEEINKDTANIFVLLLTETCKEQAKKVMKYEGQAAFESSFKVLGQVAMRELMSNPKVKAGTGAFAKYIDEDKMKYLKPSE